MKQSIKMYRNIKGVYYQQWTFDSSLFDECKKECKELGLKYRIINGEFFREVKNK